MVNISLMEVNGFVLQRQSRDMSVDSQDSQYSHLNAPDRGVSANKVDIE